MKRISVSQDPSVLVPASISHKGRQTTDLTGRPFGSLVVVKLAGKHPDGGKLYWELKCECGVVTYATTGNLLSGRTTSCGCKRLESISKALFKHGSCNTPEYSVYKGMIQRCYNERNKSYAYYGGRGIVVCERWLNSVENFLSDMGKRPDGYTIERKDTNGNYEPGNCIWTTRGRQSRNKNNNIFAVVGGEKVLLKDHLKTVGRDYGAMLKKIKSGMMTSADLKAIGASAISHGA